ncbi:MAG: hypothetical protein ABIJ00_10730 [Candidatus Eisenbacteria bacterium]
MKAFGMGVVLTLFLIGSVVSLYAGPPPKVTGGVEFTRMEDIGEVTAKAEFEAHAEQDGRPAKGMFKYSDSMGREARIDVDCVYIRLCECCCCATFSGPVVKTNMREWEGQWVQVWTRDGGSSGAENDLIGATLYSYDPGCHASQPPEWWEVIHGNLVIHRCGDPPIRAGR